MDEQAIFDRYWDAFLREIGTDRDADTGVRFHRGRR